MGELFYDQLSGEAGRGPFIFNFSLPLTPEELKESLEFLLFNHLQLNYYWQQCQPGQGQTIASATCNSMHPESVASFSFLSGYQGIQNTNNELFVFLEAPGYYPYLRRPFPEPEPPF